MAWDIWLGDGVAGSVKSTIPIGGMQCSFCSTAITKAVSGLQGVNGVYVSTGNGEMLVEYQPNLINEDKIKNTLISLGYTLRDRNKLKRFEQGQQELSLSRSKFLRSALLSIFSLATLILFMKNTTIPHLGNLLLLFSILFSFLNIFYVGGGIMKMAFGAIRRRIFNQHVLMEFASMGALVGGFLGLYYGYPAIPFFSIASFIASYHLLGAYLSTATREQSDEALMGLMALQPEITHLVSREGTTIDVETSKINVGDVIEVRPGERVPLDGVVIEGHSSVDQSQVTGENLPLNKNVGDEIISGSVNLEGPLRIQVKNKMVDSFISQVFRIVQESRATKPGIIQILDRILKYFVPLVLGSAATAFLVWMYIPYLSTGHIAFEAAIYAAVSALIMGYPCALGMSTPLALESAHLKAMKKGILFRSSDSIHAISKIDTLVLDKTGTVTEGQLAVRDFFVSQANNNLQAASIILSLEKISNHPVARSLVSYMEEIGVDPLSVADTVEVPGQGVEGKIGGKKYFIGGKATIVGKKMDSSLEEHYMSVKETGNIMIFLSDEEWVIAIVSMGDRIRKGMDKLVDWCHHRGIGVYMFTGDSYEAARNVAGLAHIESFIAEMRPNEKRDRIFELQQKGRKVAFMGDGINDAPALTQADVGITIGTGTDIAKDSSDIVLVRPEPALFSDAVMIGRKGFSKTKQNLSIAFGVNTVGLALSIAGIITPLYAMTAMISSALIVLANSLGVDIFKNIILSVHGTALSSVKGETRA